MQGLREVFCAATLSFTINDMRSELSSRLSEMERLSGRIPLSMAVRIVCRASGCKDLDICSLYKV